MNGDGVLEMALWVRVPIVGFDCIVNSPRLCSYISVQRVESVDRARMVNRAWYVSQEGSETGRVYFYCSLS